MKLAISLLFASVCIAAPITTSSASESLTCVWIGAQRPSELPPTIVGDPKTGCNPGPGPDWSGYIGPAVYGGIDGPLAVSGGTGPWRQGYAAYDFSSSGTDSAVAGSILNLTWNWTTGDDITAGEFADADFWLNGVRVWSEEKGYSGNQYGFIRTEIIGPFICATDCIWQADVRVFGGGNGVSVVKSELIVTDPAPEIAPVTEVPEPMTVALVMVGLAGILMWARRSYGGY